MAIYTISRGHCVKAWTGNPVELLNAKIFLNPSGEVHKLHIRGKSAYQEVSLEALHPQAPAGGHDWQQDTGLDTVQPFLMVCSPQDTWNSFSS